MNTIPHEAVSASAGSGKTFQLAHRYIRLLASGVKAERIIALTFSRKAAGEIFDSIIKYLCHAATSPRQARITAELICHPILCQDDFLRLLRQLLDELNRLHIGTLDSFTVGIIRAFPMELGISGMFAVMDSEGAQALTAQQEVLHKIFNNRYVDRKAQQEFMEAFKQATYGQEEKGLERNLNSFIRDYRKHFHSLPSPDAWGSPDIIWPYGSPWLIQTDDVSRAGETLQAMLTQVDWPEKVINRWNTFIDAAVKYDPKTNWSNDIKYLLEKLLDKEDGLRDGNATINMERSKIDLSHEECRAALLLLTHIMKTELESAMEKTRGIYRVLEQYELVYDEMIRQKGKLTFNEVQYLLTTANTFNNGTVLSQQPDAEARLYIDYRLDCRLDHWLLDEFQDTSDLQWEALQNLADEVLQDSSGERSFFYVGDVKQAIYGWRGGNARLFGSILNQYGGRIHERPLSTSFRSSPPVIDIVNRVFGQLPLDQLPAGTIGQWERSWQEHECQHGFVPDTGYAAVIEPISCDGETKPTEEDRYHVVASLLKELDPIRRGLSTAILVRSNEGGRRISNYLRRQCPNMKVVHEGRAAIKDNPVVGVLLSLAKFAAHPGDSFAWQHLQMSPFRTYLEEHRLTRENLSLQLLHKIQNTGFQSFIRQWGEKFNSVHHLDGFGRQRLNNLIAAAGEFESTKENDCDAFLHFIDNYQIHDPASDDAIRVMTIHQSKGLGFDIVILPDLQGTSMIKSDDIEFVTARDPFTQTPLWALKMPRKLVAQSDPVLATQIEASNEAASFDALCLLYVAMTRARQGLYMITSFPGKYSRTFDSAALLKRQLTGEMKPAENPTVTIASETFTCLYESGDREWYTEIDSPKEHRIEQSAQWPMDFVDYPSTRTVLARISPSSQIEYQRPAGDLFSPDYYESLQIGTAVHELFQQISWLNDIQIDELIENWNRKSTIEPEIKERAITEFKKALSYEEIRNELTRTSSDRVEVWLERPFEVIVDGQWITGTFDRVVITKDVNNTTLKASLIDYKTDGIDSEPDLESASNRYRPQLLLYQKALSQLLKLDESTISLKLVFTRSGRVYDLR